MILHLSMIGKMFYIPIYMYDNSVYVATEFVYHASKIEWIISKFEMLSFNWSFGPYGK